MGIRKNKETEYLYASARVRAAENHLIGSDKLEAAVMANGKGEIEALINGLDGAEGTDKLSLALSSAYDFIGEVSPDESISSFLRYIYDCNNIKSALKCHFRKIDPDEMLFSFGTVAPEAIKKMPIDGDYSALPKNMANGAEEAAMAFVKTRNPQLIDIILDKACFADMLDAAKKSGENFVLRLVVEKIDLINIMMCVRTLRQGGGFAEAAVLIESLIDGGEIEKERLISAFELGSEKLCELVRDTKYAPVAGILSKGESITLSELECAFDNFYMETVRSTKFLPFGAPILCSYLIAMEYQVKNLRIILAGKEAGLPAEKLRRRVRTSYV